MRDRPARTRDGGSAVVFATALVALLLAFPPAPGFAAEADDAPAEATEPSSEASGVFTPEEIVSGIALPIDVLLVRPLGVVQTAVGFVLFLPTALFSLWDYPDTTQEAWELFVSEPAKNVYERPLGDF